MILGQTIFETGESFYGQWFGSPSDGAVFTCDAIMVKSSFLRFYVVVQTKNSGESDASATTAVAFGAISSVGRVTATATGLKQLVRYRYAVNSDPLTGVEWVHFRMVGPTWL